MEKQSMSDFKRVGTVVMAANIMASESAATLSGGSKASAAKKVSESFLALTGIELSVNTAIKVPGFVGRGLNATAGIFETLQQILEPIIYWEHAQASSFIVASIVATYFVALMRWGFPCVILILLSTVQAYRRLIVRLRRRIYQEQRLVNAILTLEGDGEPMEWFNLLLSRYWGYFEPQFSAGLMQSLNDTLIASRPAFVEDLRFTIFTLGSRAPRIEWVKAFTRTEEDTFRMDLMLSFAPADRAEGIEASPSSSHDTKLQLLAKIGTGPAVLPIPILLTHIEVKGTMRVEIKLMHDYPHIRFIQVVFLETPFVDFILRPLKGLDVKDYIPGMSVFLTDLVQNALNSSVVEPNRISIDLEEMFTANQNPEAPVGILRISLFEMRSVPGGDSASVRLLIGSREKQLFTFSVDPQGKMFCGDTVDIILTNATFSQIEDGSDLLQLELVTSSAKRIGATKTLKLEKWIKMLALTRSSVTDLAQSTPVELPIDSAAIPMSQNSELFLKDPIAGNQTLSAESNDLTVLIKSWGTPFDVDSWIWKRIWPPSMKQQSANPLGDLKICLTYFPLLNAAHSINTRLQHKSGLITIKIHQAKGLPIPKHSHVECHIHRAGILIGTTKVKKKTNAPVWEESFTNFYRDVEKSLKFSVYQEGGPLVSSCTISMVGISDKLSKEGWFTLSGSAAKLRVTIQVNMFDPTDSRKIYTGEHFAGKFGNPPLGMLRIHVKEAKSLANVEMLRKSDPYLKVSLGGEPIGETHVKMNTLDPEWDEVFYAVCFNPDEIIRFSAFDWNNVSRDKLLGRTQLTLSNLLECLSVLLPSKSDSSQQNMGPDAGHTPPLNRLDTVHKLKLSGYSKSDNDGLKVTKIDDLSADIWAPMYINDAEVGTFDHEEKAEVESHVPASGAKNGPRSLTSAFTGMGESLTDAIVDVSSMTTNMITGGKRVKQKGHVHFKLEFFPVINDSIIYPKVGSDHRIHRNQRNPNTDSVDVRETPEEEKINLITSEYQSGIIYLNVHSILGDLGSQLGRYFVTVLLNEDLFFTTHPTKPSTEPWWHENCYKYVTNVKANVTIQLLSQDEKTPNSSKANILAQWMGNLADILGRHYVELDLERLQKSNPYDDYILKVDVSCGYYPLALEGNINEQMKGTGTLFLDILEATGLESVDSNGTSDPYCIIYMNGEQIHKTKVHKKTLNPVFSEPIKFEVKSRLQSNVVIKIFDWNQLSKHTLMASLKIRLAEIPIFESVTGEFTLEDARSGKLKLRIFFDPHTASSVDALVRGKGLGSRKSSVLGWPSHLFKRDNHHAAGVVVSTTTPDLKNALTSSLLNLSAVAEDDGGRKGPADDFRSANQSFAGTESFYLAMNQDTNFVGAVKLTIFEARNLHCAQGDPSCYVKVYQLIRGKTVAIHKTSVCHKTSNPVWSSHPETAEFKVPPRKLKIIVKQHSVHLFNVSAIGGSYSKLILGEVTLDLKELLKSSTSFEGWIGFDRKSRDEGELRIKIDFTSEVETKHDVASVASSKGP